MALGYSLVTLVGLYLLQSVLAAEHWGYPDPESTDVFPKWGGICDNGRLQSPIDLTVAGSLKGVFPELSFHNYDKTLSSPLLVNNGHTVKLSKFSVAMTLSGGPLSHKYNVEEVHLHWWSEHTIDKKRYPLEAHIVHRNKKYPNITEAANHKDGIAVVGVLFHVSNKPNTGVGKIAENIEFINAADEINKPVILEQKLNLRELFPTISSGYLTYEGSLTTPSCAESVTWIVLLDTFPITLEQVNQFKLVETTEGKKLSNNYREAQKKNNRAVVVIQESRSLAAPSTAASTIVLIGSLLFMFLRSTFQQ